MDKVFRRDVLWRAWAMVRANNGAPGTGKTRARADAAREREELRAALDARAAALESSATDLRARGAGT